MDFLLLVDLNGANLILKSLENTRDTSSNLIQDIVGQIQATVAAKQAPPAPTIQDIPASPTVVDKAAA